MTGGAHDGPWTDPDPIVVPTTPYLTFPFSHLLLLIAVCGAWAGVDGVAGTSSYMSTARSWASIATAAGFAAVALLLPRFFRGEIVVAADGVARRYRSRPWQWVPVEQVRTVMLTGTRVWRITFLRPLARPLGGSVLGWRLRDVRDALRAKSYDVSGP